MTVPGLNCYSFGLPSGPRSPGAESGITYVYPTSLGISTPYTMMTCRMGGRSNWFVIGFIGSLMYKSWREENLLSKFSSLHIWPINRKISPFSISNQDRNKLVLFVLLTHVEVLFSHSSPFFSLFFTFNPKGNVTTGGSFQSHKWIFIIKFEFVVYAGLRTPGVH